jgi:FAD dependent oxidoreductase
LLGKTGMPSRMWPRVVVDGHPGTRVSGRLELVGGLSRWNLSLWMGTTPMTSYSRLSETYKTDVVVTGGGITGLTTALLFAQRGVSVAVLEAHHLAAGTTGYTTAKITSLHSLIYVNLRALIYVNLRASHQAVGGKTRLSCMDRRTRRRSNKLQPWLTRSGSIASSPEPQPTPTRSIRVNGQRSRRRCQQRNRSGCQQHSHRTATCRIRSRPRCVSTTRHTSTLVDTHWGWPLPSRGPVARSSRSPERWTSTSVMVASWSRPTALRYEPKRPSSQRRCPSSTSAVTSRRLTPHDLMPLASAAQDRFLAGCTFRSTPYAVSATSQHRGIARSGSGGKQPQARADRRH